MTNEAEQQKPGGGLATRVLTAVIGAPILLVIILVGAAWMWFLVILAAIVLGLIEYFGMTTTKEELPVAAMGVIMGALLATTWYFAPEPVYIMAGVLGVTMIMFITVIFAYGKIERATALITVGITGVCYVGLLTVTLALLRRDPGELGRYWVVFLLALTWAGDTGAYFTGRFLGRHKLAPVVSPKKTWEGAIGGLVASVGAAFLVVALTPLVMHPLVVLLISAPAAAFGQLGDLAESLLKRSCKVKDSGKLLPGHGGILDRIDGLIFAGPYVFFFYTFGSHMGLHL